MTTGSTVSSSRTLINQRESMWGNSVGVPTRFGLSPDLYHWSSDEVLSWYCTHSHLTGIGSSSIFWHSDCLCPLSCSKRCVLQFLTANVHSRILNTYQVINQENNVEFCRRFIQFLIPVQSVATRTFFQVAQMSTPGSWRLINWSIKKSMWSSVGVSSSFWPQRPICPSRIFSCGSFHSNDVPLIMPPLLKELFCSWTQWFLLAP